ncbi:MAG: glycosyl hydrolase family 18 protein [Tissierellaceae bacterium]
MKKTIAIISIILALGLIVGGIYFIRERSNSQVIAFSDDLFVIIEDIPIEDGEPVFLEDEEIYIDFDTVKRYIDEDIFYDEDEEMVIVTDKSRVRRYKIDDNIATVNSKEFIIEKPIKLIHDRIYIPMEIYDNCNIDINYYPDTNGVVIDYIDMYYLNGEVVLEGAHIRTDLDKKAPILLKDLKIGTSLNVYGEYEQWYKVRTIDGILGFMEKKYLKLNHTKDLYKTELMDREGEQDIKSQKINLTWDYTYRKLNNVGNIDNIVGVNIISPTWFSIRDSNGEIIDKGNREYVKKYNELGYELWPLIDNSFNPDLTHELLKSSQGREKLINSILDIYLDYGFEGINIDFENVYLKDRDLLTQFIRELYPIFKENGMYVSMDVTPISTSENWSKSFDRRRLVEVVDYLMLMAYDQHWAASPIAGSVAQYSWVENSLKRVFQEIPREKIILAVPYYTRLWIIEDEKISSQSLSMDVANRFIYENKIELIWDDESMQYYGELDENGISYRIWLEDGESLSYKASLVNKYDLAGIASWRKGFETEDVWSIINKTLD